jgi:hypothetical protein
MGLDHERLDVHRLALDFVTGTGTGTGTGI